ncbi:ABC1 [Uncinocarpus reesii 1704]|uniref:ABC1 n=1 Tax=Uncinocarpus reesii (strain UAMH 1704) TaxID=336963 RepID=C4JP17_UNCRE|nr:ABC1 [Uncinocarpus reesii 1704]EEP78231.1 ABC1 [Uncinocarpus reesii 1704]
MSGRRLLDAIAIFNATRNVAAKHIALQRQHLDVHARTSSLTKGAKLQADRLGLALKAAADLARKLDDIPTHNTVARENAGAAPPATDKNGGGNATEGPRFGQAVKDVASGENWAEAEIASIKPAERKQWEDKGNTSPLAKDINEEKPRDPLEQSVNADSATSSQSPENPDGEKIGSQNELPNDMMKQLFRSRKMSSSLFAGRHGANLGSMDERAKSRTSSPEAGGMQPVNSSPSADAALTDSEPRPASPGSASAATQNWNQADNAGIFEQIPTTEATETPLKQGHGMIESRVPSSRLGRIWEYSGLATSMAFGVMGEGIRRVTGNEDAGTGSLLLSPANIERLVAKLSRMRGAALKLGQMLSFQDSKMLPPTIQEVLQRVQDRANYMPASQRNKVLKDNLGPEWRNLFDTFDEIPMAAASIGQVHAATLKETGQRVAVKVQYPGVADSIDSDLNNLSILLTASRLLPKGLYLDKTIANARTELAWECDYIREAECALKFKHLLQDETATFLVPDIIPYASGKQVLTMERMDGIAVTKIQNFTQAQRDWIGTQLLRLCFREICEFRYMQTDPNWTNFLYNAATNRLELLDFGASRAYPTSFINTYVRILVAACRNDREVLHDLSIKLGYLTGFESQAMVNAHVESILTLAEPFGQNAPDVYDFSDQTITERVKQLIPLMLRERLAPPPEETYSLHRKLSGAFLLCARLGSRVRCRELFEDAVSKVEWSEGGGESRQSAAAN